MIENVLTLLGKTGTQDEELINLLNLLIMQTEEEVLDFTHRDCILGMENLIVQMVVYRYNTLGTENLKGETYSGLSYSYTCDYPENILRMLKRYRKLVTA